MKGGKKPWWFFVVAGLILLLNRFGDRLAETNLILIPVIALFVLVFGIMVWQSIGLWKKPDKEILSEYLVLAVYIFASDVKETKTLVQRFLAAGAFAAFVLYKMRNGSLAPYLFCGALLLITGLPLLRALLTRNREKQDGPDYREGAAAAIIVGLITCGFMCFFIGIGVYHGVWWFVLPPGLIFLSLFSRPLAAGVRFLLHKEKDPGEQHINRRRDIDPWDRPDRKL